MTPRFGTTILILLLLLAASVVSSGRVPHPLGRGPRAAEGSRAGVDDLRRLILNRAHDAYAAGDAGRAWTAWREAFSTARSQHDWRGLVDVGDAALGMDSRGRARQSYSTALTTAREERSVDGVLRAGEAFAGIGDRRTTRYAVRIAERLADDDPTARARVRDFAAVHASPSTGSSPAASP
jgi:hypothetical protein